MGRFKKRFKGVCWKRKSADSDVEDESEKQKTPNGERSQVKGKKKPQKLSREDELKKHVIDLDLHMSNAVNDMLDKLDRLDMLNLEIINEFVGMLDVDRNSKVVRLVGEGEDGKEESKHKNAQQTFVSPDLVKVEPRVSEVGLAQTADVKQHAGNDTFAMHPKERITMPYLQRDDIVSVVHEFPDEEPSCVVDESVDVNNTLVKCSLREMGTHTDDTHVSVSSTCSEQDMPFTRETIYDGSGLTKDKQEGRPTPHIVIPVEMKSIGCETECLVESRKLSNQVLIDNGVQVTETEPSKTEMKSIAVNTEGVVESTKRGQPSSVLFNRTKVWDMIPFEVYCRRTSVPEPVPLRDGESPYRCLYTRPASKSRLSKFNLKIPKVFSNYNTTHTMEKKSAKDLTTKSEGGSLNEKGGTDTTAIDVDRVAPQMFGHRPTSDDLKTTHTNESETQRLVEPMHIPQLGMLCRKMSFDDTAHAPDEAGGDIGSYRLCGPAMAYTNAAHQRLNAETHCTSNTNITVMSLREMCRQLLGDGGLGIVNPIVDPNLGNGFGTITRQDYNGACYKECFTPELNNADMNGVDSHHTLDDLLVKGRFGALGTSYENLKYPHAQLVAFVPHVFGSEPTQVHFQRIRMICRKMLIDEILHALNKVQSDAVSNNLSEIAIAYINATPQRLKEGIHLISNENTVVNPLREMCRHLLRKALVKQGPVFGLIMGDGFDIDVQPDAFKDVGATAYFGPKLPNTDLNKVNSLLGAAVTSDEGPKDQRSELMAVVPYISRSGSTLEDMKATYNGEVEKQRVVESVHISQLRMLCRKMFFDDKPYASNQAEIDTCSYKLSSLALAYMNAAHQRLNADTHCTSSTNITVMSLREMCRQLLGDGGLGIVNPIVDPNLGNGFGTIARQDYNGACYKKCFTPELNNADMNGVDSHHTLDDLLVKGQFGALGTSYENLKYPHAQLVALVPHVFGSEPTQVHFQRIRMICRKMLIDEILHALNQVQSDAVSNNLSEIAIAYINATPQRLKEGIHLISNENTVVNPLREMCRHLLRKALVKQGPVFGLIMGNGFDIDVQPDAFKDVGATAYFGPKLPNTDLNKVNSLLGATVTSDEGPKDQRSELMAVVPYISRSASTLEDMKATYNGEVEKQRVVESIHISQLRMLCRKMFFDDKPYASNQAEIDTCSYKLSSLALAYMNAAHQRLKAETHHNREKHMMVLPLRELCRQQVGIGLLLVKGQFGAAPTPAENMTSHKEKLVDHADNTVTRVKQLSRIPKLALPTIDKCLTTPVGPITLKYLMERYVERGTFKEIHIKFLSYNLLEGLKFLHRKGIAHKFIFPRRIMFNSNGYPSLMSDNEVVGRKIQPRIEYSSPELISCGPITTATDIFQVGLLAYLVMYGRSPYKADTYSETKMNLLDDDFTPQFENATLSRDGRYFIRKCLRKDPAMRFNLVKCKRSLEYVVNWFYLFKGEDLANQKYTSPFKDLVQINT